MVAVVDYGAGNLKSVCNSLAFLGVEAKLVRHGEELCKFERVVLPGVGAFGEAMARLKAAGLDEALREFVKSGKPFLGICLGMQLLFERSFEFGETAGLGVLKGEVVRFEEAKFESPQKIPHMGWNKCAFVKKSALNVGVDEAYFYFVHSFHVRCFDESDVLAKTSYGYEFASAVAHENLFGFQPHPEKSGKSGLAVLEKFAKMQI